MLSSTVWRAREPRAEADTIPTFGLSAFEAPSMGVSSPESLILAVDMHTRLWSELRAIA